MTKISRFARNDDTGKALGAATVFSFHCFPYNGKDFGLLPPSSGRRCPEGAEVGSCYRLKKNVRYAFPRFVIPSPAEGSFSFPVSLFLRNAVYMKHRDPTSHGVRCFPLSAVLASFPDRERKRFLAFARNNDRACGILACICQNAERTIKKEIPFLRFPFLIQVRLQELTN